MGFVFSPLSLSALQCIAQQDGQCALKMGEVLAFSYFVLKLEAGFILCCAPVAVSCSHYPFASVYQLGFPCICHCNFPTNWLSGAGNTEAVVGVYNEDLWFTVFTRDNRAWLLCRQLRVAGGGTLGRGELSECRLPCPCTATSLAPVGPPPPRPCLASPSPPCSCGCSQASPASLLLLGWLSNTACSLPVWSIFFLAFCVLFHSALLLCSGKCVGNEIKTQKHFELIRGGIEMH